MVIAAQVGGDGPDPGSGIEIADPLRGITLQRPIGAQVGLLGDLLGIVAISHQAQRSGEDPS